MELPSQLLSSREIQNHFAETDKSVFVLNDENNDFYFDEDEPKHFSVGIANDKGYVPVKSQEMQSLGREDFQHITLEDDVSTSADIPYERGTCGFGICTFKWAQRCASLPLFVFLYGFTGIWMTTLGPFLGTQVTSIQRHLGLSNSDTGLLLSANDVGYLLAVMIGSHLGKFSHIPRTLTASAAVFGLATASMSFGRLVKPHIGLGSGDVPGGVNLTNTTSEPSYLCEMVESQPATTTMRSVSLAVVAEEIASKGSSLPWAFWVMLIAAVIGGAMKSYRIPLLTYYVEGNVKNKNHSGLLMGVAFTVMMFGTPIALLLGAVISSIPVDLQDTTLTKQDQRWIGAWWLGFLLIGVCCVIFATPVCCFPRKLRMEADTSVRQGNSDSTGKKKWLKSAKIIALDLPKSMKRIFHQPVFIITLVLGCVEGFTFAGYFAFTQKYMEIQFNISSQQVSMSLGILVIFSLVVGTSISGVVSSKLKLGVRGSAIALTLISVIVLPLAGMNLYLGCQNSFVTGLDDQGQTVEAPCTCGKESVLLVCSENGTDYLSPCYAGCMNKTENSFSNCTAEPHSQLHPGLCDLKCPYFPYYMATFFLSTFIGCLSFVPGYLLIVRSVSQKDVSLATGTISFFQALVGTLPSPVVFGKIVDSACRFWSPTGGHCMLYDREKLRWRFHGLYTSLRVFHLVVIFTLLYVALRATKRSKSRVNR